MPEPITESQARGTAVVIALLLWIPLLLATPASLAAWIEHDNWWPMVVLLVGGFCFFMGATFTVFAALGGLMEETWRRRKKN